jgi:hypothetical protein
MRDNEGIMAILAKVAGEILIDRPAHPLACHRSHLHSV